VELREWLRVDERAGRPLFDQLRNQIIEAIRAGTLPPGARLPTVRELAGELGLAVNTVARAYRELEIAGIVETRGRFGTFVARADPSDTAMAPRRAPISMSHAGLDSARPRRCATSRPPPRTEPAGLRVGQRRTLANVRKLRVVVDDLYRFLPIVLPMVLSSVWFLGTCQ